MDSPGPLCHRSAEHSRHAHADHLVVHVIRLAALVATTGAPPWLTVRCPRRPAASAGIGNWPQWRGPNRDNLSTETGLLKAWDADGPAPVWQSPGLGAGFSSVAVAGAASTRWATWRGPVGAGAVEPPTESSSGRPRSGPPGTTAIPGRAARRRWTASWCMRSAPKATWSRSRRRRARSAGAKSLTRDFGGQIMSNWKFSESPLVDGDRVIVTPGARGAALVALDKRTGKAVWRPRCPTSARRDVTAPATRRW